MAESTPEAPPKKGGLIKIIILAAGVLLLAGGGFFGWRWWAGRQKAKEAALAVKAGEAKDGKDGKDARSAHGGEDEEDDAEEGKAGGGHGGGAGGMAVLALKPIVNLENSRKNAYLKCELHIVFRDPELGKQATSDKPTVENSTVRALVLETLSGKTLEEASDPEARENIRKELKEKLNERFAQKPKKGDKEEKGKHPKKPVKDVLIVDWAIAS